MARNEAENSDRGSETPGPGRIQPPKTGGWTRRDPSTGRFAGLKKEGGQFEGVRRER